MSNNGFFHLFNCSMWKLIYRTRDRAIELEDLPELNANFATETLTNNLDIVYKNELEGTTSSRLFYALWKCFMSRFTLVGAVLLSLEMSLLGLALTLRVFILAESSSEKWLYGVILLCLIWYSQIAKTVVECFWRELGCRMKISVRGLMFRRLLSKTHIQSEGHFVNLITADMEKIAMVSRCAHFMWITPFCLFLYFVVIFVLYDWDALLGFPIILVFFLLSVYCGKLCETYTKRYTKTADVRLDAMHQSLNGIYTVKVSQMESAILQLINNYRMNELKNLMKHSLCDGLTNSLMYVVRVPVLIVLIAAYLLIHNSALTASYIFSLALLYSFIQDLSTYRIALAGKELFDFKLAIVRLGSFLDLASEAERIDQENTIDKLSKWAIAHPGQMLQIIGNTGSGKTTIAKTLTVSLENKFKISFTTQKRWIFGGTIRENILCGRSFDSERYWKTISVCQLAMDLRKAKNGDQTQVGVRGVQLSGGQRARVAIARAIYTVAEIYIFDDPLKSLNPSVSSQLFKAGFVDFLQQRTRIIFVSKYHVSDSSDQLLLRLKRNVGLEEVAKCSIDTHSESGSNDELDLDQTSPQCVSNHHEEVSQTLKPTAVLNEHKQLLEQNHKNKPKQETIQSMLQYFSYAPLWLRWTTAVLLIVAQVVINLSDVCLFFWVRCNDVCDQWYFFKSYVAISVVGAFLTVARSLLLRYLCCTIAQNLHHLVTIKVVYAPMEFFWAANSGDVQNRFSSDLRYLDYEIPMYIDFSTQTLIGILGYIITICCLYPIFLIAVVPAFCLLALIRRFINTLDQEIQALRAESEAPLIEHFCSVANGFLTIKSCRLQKYVESIFQRLSDCHSRQMLASLRSSRFFINIVCIVLPALLTIIVLLLLIMGENSTVAGFVVYYGVQMITRCQFSVYLIAHLESIMVHFRRLSEYTTLVPEQHPDMVVPHNNETTLSKTGIVFNKVSVQYKGSPNWAIKNVSLTVKGAQITGIAGRTGCGKSTLLSALLRIITYEGDIRVADHDLNNHSLSGLRNCFSMLPQDSMVFSEESVRWNLDPYNLCSETAIWEALEVLGIKNVIRRKSLGLDCLVKNAELSAGEARLFCFARVLLNSNEKILLLDEPTDCVDMETESKIWQAIQEKLQHRTILVVAHSKNLLKKCDQVIQMTEE